MELEETEQDIKDKINLIEEEILKNKLELIEKQKREEEILKNKLELIEKQKREENKKNILKLFNTKNLLEGKKFHVLDYGTKLDYVSMYGTCPRISLCMKDKGNKLSKKLGIEWYDSFVEHNGIFVNIRCSVDYINIHLSACEDKYDEVEDKVIEESGTITDGYNRTAMPEFIVSAKKTLDYLGVVVGGLNSYVYYKAFKFHADRLIKELKVMEKENKKKEVLSRFISFLCKQ